jgi:hypothetical protein
MIVIVLAPLVLALAAVVFAAKQVSPDRKPSVLFALLAVLLLANLLD